jgi:hypothetical protein
MAGAKRRQEEERGMRVSPENVNFEDADGFARTRRHHRGVKCLSPEDLPGTWAHIETSRKGAEQERPGRPQKELGGMLREKIEGACCECRPGVGPLYSSEEAAEGRAGRRGGAKGAAEQGTRGRER